jgi:hypothetical protein
MKSFVTAVVFAGAAWLVATTSSIGAPPPNADFSVAAAATVAPASLNEVVAQYCVACHNDQLRTGNLSLQGLDVERAADQAETAEKMIRKLRAGMMPPPGMPRPSADTLLALVETLEAKVDAAARGDPSVGGRRFQRLSRAEYERVIHDLLDLEVDAGQWLPRDILMGSFDNQSAAQAFSTTLVDSFLRAATEISRLAVGNPEAASATSKYLNADRASQQAWDRLEGAPFGSRGGMVVTHSFPADGQYVFQAVTSQGGGNNIWFEDLDISIDGEPVALLKLEHNGGSTTTHQTPPIFLRAGQHRVAAAFVNMIEGPYEDRFGASPSSAAGRGGAGTTALTHLGELWITGPNNVTGVSETPSRRRVFTCQPATPEQARPCAETILGRLANEAYRRPVPREAVVDLMRLYDEAAAKDGFEVGVRTGLQAILMSPDFLFRLERAPVDVRPGQEYRLSDLDLASRLSFFLWATAPDEQLLQVAASGRLSEPRVLEEQVERMLEDPRSEALATRFAHQWLRLQDVGAVWPRPDLYPSFSQQLAGDLVRETQLLFQHLIREDRSMLELLSADYTFLNERLARHYGIDGIYGDEFRRVPYPDAQRRGILAHGSMLQLTSMAERTSPVLRGKWVMEVVIGTPPPPPPPNVPPFEASPAAAGGRRLTTRERMEMHRAAPLCNSCHRFMDPIGLALDNFDVTGQWRIRENMTPLDTRGALYDGTSVSTPGELVDALLKRPIPLVRNFTGQLLSYSLGRPLEYTDQPTVRAIARAAEPGGYRMSSLIMGVVKSDAFQMRQTQTTAN